MQKRYIIVAQTFESDIKDIIWVGDVGGKMGRIPHPFYFLTELRREAMGGVYANVF